MPVVRKHCLEDFHLNFVDSLEDISMAEQQVLLHMPIVLPEESLPNCGLVKQFLTPDSCSSRGLAVLISCFAWWTEMLRLRRSPL